MGKPIIIVQGGQYGSESKGLVTAKLAQERKVDVAIRTGTVNAGHTVYYNGIKYAMQQLPVAWVRPECKLVLGPGAYISPEILEREITWINIAMGDRHGDVRNRIYIDLNCGIHLPAHTDRSTKSGRHHAMGATGKGSSEAVVQKIMSRGVMNPQQWLYREFRSNSLKSVGVCDTVHLVNRWFDDGEQLLIEGTQGTLLDLHLGPYPFTTHKQTQAANWMAEAGLSCTLPTELVSVMRTFPIRVAGNSGPLPQETTWSHLAAEINSGLHRAGKGDLVHPISLVNWENAVAFQTGTLGDPGKWTGEQRATYPALASEAHKQAWTTLSDFDRAELGKLFEMTTVTKKLRRVGRWDWEDARRSVMLNRPASLAITFMNYVIPALWGMTSATISDFNPELVTRAVGLLANISDNLQVPVAYAGFGPAEDSLIPWGVLLDAR